MQSDQSETTDDECLGDRILRQMTTAPSKESLEEERRMRNQTTLYERGRRAGLKQAARIAAEHNFRPGFAQECCDAIERKILAALDNERD